MDHKTAKGFILLTTYGRVKTNLPRFFLTARATGMTAPGYVVVDEKDYAENVYDYDNLDMPENWSIHLVRGGSCGEATEQAYQDLIEPDTQYVMWLADDMTPETKHWDAKLVSKLNGWNIVSCDDGHQAPKRMNGAITWSADLLRAVGYIYPAGMKHFYVDDVWESLGRLMNCWQVDMSVLISHKHFTYAPGAGLEDATYDRSQKFWVSDEQAYSTWKNHERLAAAERIGQLLKQYGVAQDNPDLSHVKLLITTPCGDGRYERLYMSSLQGTIQLLRQCNAQVNFLEMPYCSDICLARTKIMGGFLRSDSNYMLSIDSDMGWNPYDVIRLFQHNKPFVAVAGPRKVFPPSFAVQNATEDGRALPLHVLADGVVEVSDIGFAFTLIRREVFEKVRDAHPELRFSVDGGPDEWAVFCPMVVHGRYKSEDFAFGHRWQKLGGKVYCDPSISLQHVGVYVWQGDWLSQLVATANMQQAAA